MNLSQVTYAGPPVDDGDVLARLPAWHSLRNAWDGKNAFEPGQLLDVLPPFCTNESSDGVRLAATAVDERRRFLGRLAAQIRDVPDGGRIRF